MLSTGFHRLNRVLCLCVTNLRVCVPSCPGYPSVLAAVCLELLSPKRNYYVWLLGESFCVLSGAANKKCLPI